MNKYIIIAGVVCLALMYGMWNTISSQNKEIESLTKDLNETIVKMDNLILVQNEFSSKQNKTDSNLEKTRTDLENKIGRNQTVVAKPKMVENLINKSFSEFAVEFDCITGGVCD